MKTVIAVVCFVGLLCCAQAIEECNFQTSTNPIYNCGLRGEPHFFLNKDGKCEYTCLHKGKKKSCQSAHPTFVEPYIRSLCGRTAFSCEGKGKPFVDENEAKTSCHYFCQVGDMLLTCEQTHPL
ncbi:hypothetical protein RN001_014355 [Aquatica leii]|uniref:Uncharacterized protein n=1 Tax=Aquatica leii TaxID=1421715 RepID=A0AAN7S657_9COLE|nr:hypothetical protein RN001_014355 [Aquatica leii]